jgi:LPS-assembly protein
VNAGSTKFNQYVPNNNLVNFQNQLTSTIQWSKTTSKTNLTIAANHDQNNVTRLVNMRLPNVTYSVLTFYPFQKKERAGTEKWYEKLGLSYAGSLTNQLSFFDSAINARRLLDTLQWGISHRVPVSLALPSLGPVTLSPSINYEERWLGRSVTYKWNDISKRIDSFYAKSFYTVRDVSVGISANTRIFGTFQFGKKSKVQAIRHEIRPSVGFAYKPDLAKQYWDSVQVDENGRKIPYSKFQANCSRLSARENSAASRSV